MEKEKKSNTDDKKPVFDQSTQGNLVIGGFILLVIIMVVAVLTGNYNSPREIPTFYVVWVLWEHIVRGYCAPVMVFVTMEVQLYLRLSQHQQRS